MLFHSLPDYISFFIAHVHHPDLRTKLVNFFQYIYGIALLGMLRHMLHQQGFCVLWELSMAQPWGILGRSPKLLALCDIICILLHCDYIRSKDVIDLSELSKYLMKI